MTKKMKHCYILDSSRGFIFKGHLDKNSIGTDGYHFYEVPKADKDRPLKIVDNHVVVDFQKEYDNKIEYQKRAFKEYREDILKKIQYASILGKSIVVADLTDMLNHELMAYENRINAINLDTE